MGGNRHAGEGPAGAIRQRSLTDTERAGCHQPPAQPQNKPPPIRGPEGPERRGALPAPYHHPPPPCQTAPAKPQKVNTPPARDAKAPSDGEDWFSYYHTPKSRPPGVTSQSRATTESGTAAAPEKCPPGNPPTFAHRHGESGIPPPPTQPPNKYPANSGPRRPRTAGRITRNLPHPRHHVKPTHPHHKVNPRQPETPRPRATGRITRNLPHPRRLVKPPAHTTK